jgi:hypothetical protein
LAALVLLWLFVQLTVRGHGPLKRFAIASAALPLAWPFAHEHDFTLLLFPAVFALRRSDGALRLVAILGTLLVAVDWLGLAQRPGGLPQTIALTVAVSLAIGVLARKPWSAVVVGAIAVAAVIYAGSIAAALPADFHVDHAASVTSVWAAEQHASGIDRLDPVWGSLRAVSLLGCALLWFIVGSTKSESRASA